MESYSQIGISNAQCRKRYFVNALKDDEKQASPVLAEILNLYLLYQQLRDEAMDREQRTE